VRGEGSHEEASRRFLMGMQPAPHMRQNNCIISYFQEMSKFEILKFMGGKKIIIYNVFNSKNYCDKLNLLYQSQLQVIKPKLGFVKSHQRYRISEPVSKPLEAT